MNLSISTIKKVLAHRERKTMNTHGYASAAVLVPIIQEQGTYSLLLTKRTDEVEHHKGQISFPGGMVDESDESSLIAALRETEEEIGLQQSFIKILGSLDDIRIPTGFVVTPFVGYIETLPSLTTSNTEVAEILCIPLDKFFDRSLRRSEMRELRGVRREVFFYDVWKEPVWGATAAIIKQFTDLFDTLQSE